MKRIVYLTGTRADFGLMRKILRGIEESKKLELKLLATGMHLMDEFGYTIKEVEAEFKLSEIIEEVYEADDREAMARFVGKCSLALSRSLTKLKPDAVVVLGDRGEQLAMAIAAAYLAIPIVHLHGGEQTTTIDNRARNAISQLADWHLPASKGARKRLLKMAIDKRTIKVVGAPGLDEVYETETADKQDLMVVLQHPDDNEKEATKQIEATLEAVLEQKMSARVIYPNADAGGRAQIEVIEAVAKQYPANIKSVKSLPREEFIQLLSRSRVIVGNSSAGLIEAPALNLPAVNVGSRQKDRERGKNVIDASYDTKSISRAISKALGMRLSNIKNPYGDGKTAPRVIKFLNKL